MNRLKANMPVPPLPGQAAWNGAGTALLGGNAAKRTPHPTVRDEPAAGGADDDDDSDDDDETAKGADDARRPLTPARMAAMMTTYGVSPISSEVGGLWGPGVPPMACLPSVLPVPSTVGPRGTRERVPGVVSARCWQRKKRDGSNLGANGQSTKKAREDGDIDIDSDVDIDVVGESDDPPDRTVRDNSTFAAKSRSNIVKSMEPLWSWNALPAQGQGDCTALFCPPSKFSFLFCFSPFADLTNQLGVGGR